VRVLAATHADLERAVAERRFREDLYFRLAHLPIEVPPLRERREDIRLLFEHFVERAWRRHRMRPRRVDERVFPPLEEYPWPGNVRELASLSERLVVFGGDPITPDQLPARYRESTEHSPASLDPHDDAQILPLREYKFQAERAHLARALERTGGNVAAAARLLGVQRTHLHQRLVALGLRPPGGRDAAAGENGNEPDAAP